MGNKTSIEVVGVGGAGSVTVGNGVSVGRISCGGGFESIPEDVGKYPDGWKGVGVGDALGADVMRMNGSGACSGAGAAVPHEDSMIARRKIKTLRLMDFIESVR